jgi:transposase-like protein
MARKVKQELRRVWRKRIERQRKGGLTVATFCRQEGVSSATFYAWKRKLQGETPTKPKRTTTTGSAEMAASAVGSLPKARAEAAFVQLPLAPLRTSPWIELVLVEGTIIRVPQENMTALQMVLQTLGGASHSPFLGEGQHA